MFDISWSEFLLIGVVALVVIGPKELPGVLRTLGQWTRKVRSMATDFQNQFQEAMREAEMADLKKEVDTIAQDFKDFDPTKDIREDVEAASRDIERSLNRPPDEKPALPAAGETTDTDTNTAAAGETGGTTEANATAALPEPAATPAIEAAVPVKPVERSDLEAVGGEPPAKSADQAAATAGAAPPDSTGRSE